jgi:hypothetical protein
MDIVCRWALSSYHHLYYLISSFGLHKVCCLHPIVDTTFPELAWRVGAPTDRVAPAMPPNVWTELEYRYGVCRATQSARIERL